MSALIELAGPFKYAGAMTWTRRGTRRIGPSTLAQKPQTVRLDRGGYWEAVLEDLALLERETVNYWQALETLIGDGVDWVIVPRATWDTSPGGEAGSLDEAVPHSDGALFDDGTGYSGSDISGAIAADAAAGASTVQIVMLSGVVLIGGEVFSIEHAAMSHRMYQIGIATDLGAHTWSCTIAPPLREAVTAGETVEFDWPKCAMTLVNDMSFTRQAGWRGGPGVRFEEAF